MGSEEAHDLPWGVRRFSKSMPRAFGVSRVRENHFLTEIGRRAYFFSRMAKVTGNGLNRPRLVLPQSPMLPRSSENRGPEGRSSDFYHARKKTPELTLDRTVRLLAAALEEPELRLPRATALVDYHVRRNEVARKSHAKTWRARHRGVKFLR